MHISGIFVYPVKSLGGISLGEARLEQRGLAFDRRWMIVDPHGVFISQREISRMALLQPSFSDHGTLLISNRGDSNQEPLEIRLDTPEQPSNQEEVSIWDDTCQANAVSAQADAWLSKALGTACRLVYMPESSRRPVDAKYGTPGDVVSFADGYPCLIIGQASLDDLNSRLAEPITMNRFRPNLVFEGGSPFIEDEWRYFRAGEVSFRSVKPCARCEIPTINPDSSQRGKEPLTTLAQFRRQGHKILFGMNLCPDTLGLIRVGDLISFS